MLCLRLEALHAPEIAKATTEVISLLQDLITKTLTPWAIEQLSVLHEINPDPKQRTPRAGGAHCRLRPRYDGRPHDDLPGLHAPFLLWHPEEKDHLYRVALALLPE